MIHLIIVNDIAPVWYPDSQDITEHTELSKKWDEIYEYARYKREDKWFYVPENIYGLFCNLNHTNEHINFDIYGCGTWSKQSIENAKADIKYWLEHLDLAMDNGRPWKTTENWYLDYQWKAEFGDLPYENYLPFTKENLQKWLEQFLEFLNQANSSVICMGD